MLTSSRQRRSSVLEVCVVCRLLIACVLFWLLFLLSHSHSLPNPPSLPSLYLSVCMHMCAGVQFGPTSPVVTLLQKRMRDEYRRVIRAPNPREVDLRANNGLDLCAEQLRGVLLRISRVVDHNRSVFAAVYNGIIANALEAAREAGDQQQQQGQQHDQDDE